MNLKEVVGMNLKYYRYQTGLSQEKFYTNLELNPKYMACIERGSENITVDHVVNKKRIDEKEKIKN